MNIELKRDHISIKEGVSNAILDRKNRKSFKVHELHKMTEQANQKASRKVERSNRRSEQQKQCNKNHKNQDCFLDGALRSADRVQEIPQLGPQSIYLKDNSQSIKKNDFANNHSQVSKKGHENISSIRKFRNLCNLRNPTKPSYPNNAQQQHSILMPRRNPLYSKQRLSVCIESINEYSRISQRLTRAQISATQKLKTQQSRGVTIFQRQVLETPSGKLSQIKRKEVVFDDLDANKILANHRSFSPVNFKFKNYFGPVCLAKRDKEYLFDGSLGYLSVKGMSKSIEQKEKQIKFRNQPRLQKIQHHLLTVNSANLLKKRQRL